MKSTLCIIAILIQNTVIKSQISSLSDSINYEYDNDGITTWFSGLGAALEIEVRFPDSANDYLLSRPEFQRW